MLRSLSEEGKGKLVNAESKQATDPEGPGGTCEVPISHTNSEIVLGTSDVRGSTFNELITVNSWQDIKVLQAQIPNRPRLSD